jgi:dephospho-CoA kinase
MKQKATVSLIAGLTGSMGSGKSTLAKLLGQKKGVRIFDCDAISKELLYTNEGRAIVLSVFGEDVYEGDKLSITKLANRLFTEKAARQQFETLHYPRVEAAIWKAINEDTTNSIFIVESAILIEAGWRHLFDVLIVTYCNLATKIERLQSKRHVPKEEIERRLALQLPDGEKIRQANFAIHTECTLDELSERAEALYQKLTKRMEQL